MPRTRRRPHDVGAPLVLIIVLVVVASLILLLFTAVNPVGTGIGLLLSSIAMSVVLLAYRWLDRFEPEPRRLLQFAFLWGASIAVLLAVGLETFGAPVLAASPLVSQSFDQAAIFAPLVEEAAKGSFLLVMLTGRRRHELNSLTDCMVYAGVTAVGFAWMEDIVYLASADSPGTLAAVAVVRLIFAPFAHPLFTTMTGIGVYVALRRRRRAARTVAILVGYLAAVGLHASWNASLMVQSGQYFIVVYLFWMVPVFVLTIVLAILGRRGEQRVVTAKLPGMVASGLITPAEAGWLGSLRERRRVVRAARRAGGRAAGRRVSRFAVSAADVAFTRDRIDRDPDDAALFARHDAEVQELLAARSALPTAPVGYRVR